MCKNIVCACNIYDLYNMKFIKIISYTYVSYERSYDYYYEVRSYKFAYFFVFLRREGHKGVKKLNYFNMESFVRDFYIRIYNKPYIYIFFFFFSLALSSSLSLFTRDLILFDIFYPISIHTSIMNVEHGTYLYMVHL